MNNLVSGDLFKKNFLEVTKINTSTFFYQLEHGKHFQTIAIKTPAATAEPITPETFGPMACIRRWFCEFAFKPTWFTTRAAIGTAETPAAPIRGLIATLERVFISFAIKTPVAVPTEKAIIPNIRIPIVSTFRNSPAANLLPTPSPKKMVTMLIREF